MKLTLCLLVSKPAISAGIYHSCLRELPGKVMPQNQALCGEGMCVARKRGVPLVEMSAPWSQPVVAKGPLPLTR
jgi:hypothetical protein